jgi:hypothetical protein
MSRGEILGKVFYYLSWTCERAGVCNGTINANGIWTATMVVYLYKNMQKQ